jgi:hypothetical protein
MVRMVEISEVKTSRELRAFVKFPFRLYEGSPYWVPPLIRDEVTTLQNNPAFEHCIKKYWLAKRDGQIVGRIAGIINHAENKKFGSSTARFGWIDFIDDREVSTALFETVENWAREQSANHIHGPLGFTDLDKEGLLVEGFEELGTFATIYNHPYYPAHFEARGYKKSVDWVEYEMHSPKEMPPRIVEFSKKVQDRYGLRQLQATKPSEVKPYAGQVFQLLNEAYGNLYGFVELTEKQIQFYTDQYFSYINPEFVSVILNEQDVVVAFGVSMPSLSRPVQKAKGRLFPFGFMHILQAMKKNDRADLYLIATRSEYRSKGVHVLIFEKILTAFLKFGIKTVETNPELETNLQVQAIWKEFDRRQHKRRRCYAKELG